MYGLLLDSIQKFICEQYGERYWAMVRRRANLKNQWFVTHEVYSDSLMQVLVDAAAEELGQDRGTVMCMFGKYFAENIGRYGYARLLRVLGRDLRDFLNGLDDLHEYLRFSYPKMRPPSFFCECETVNGLKLHYTTKRRGYLQYVIGQLQTVGRIYGKEVEVSLMSEEISETGTTHIVLDLKFDNVEFLNQTQISVQQKKFSVGSQTFLGVFPFCLLLNKELIVQEVGLKLREVLPNISGLHLVDCFTIRKPMLETITRKEISLHANCVFELMSNSAVVRKGTSSDSFASPGMDYQTPPPQLRLKGQMLIMADNDLLAFLCSPVMDSPEDLYESGIYVNDLSMHDSSRDIILAGSQKDPELTLALSQEKIRSAQLEESAQQMDRILFQMIPKPIAMQLRNGETALNTCKEFSSVSILFSDIVSFTPMCSRLHPMEVVCVLNAMYVAFDHLCEVHHVYKTETIGDAYMAICGAPVYTVHHAEYITDFAISIIEATSKINDPSTNKSLKIRVGIHTGHVVAGVVGSTVLRYDVFGDTVNVAARMEATGEPMRIHVSEATAERLMGTAFIVKERGCVNVKGKGEMKTFWVTGKLSLPDVPEEEDESQPTLFEEERPLPSLLREEPTLTTSLHPFGPTRSTLTSPPSTPSPTCLSPPHSIHIQPSTSPSPLSPTSRHSHGGRSDNSHSSKLSRSLSPKPSEWPQAEQQLQKFESIAYDNSVPPGGRRRKTLPAVVVETSLKTRPNQRRRSAEESEHRMMNGRTSNISSTIPLEQLQQTPVMADHTHVPHPNLPPYLTQWPNLWGQRPMNGWNVEQKHALNGYPSNIAGQIPGAPLTAPITPPGAPLTVTIPPSNVTRLLGQDTVTMHRSAGDMCVKHWGGATSAVPLKASGLTLSQLQRFAAEAEVNACQARQLADQAADLVLRLQWTERNSKRSSKAGTSVDLDSGGVGLLPFCPLHLETQRESTATTGNGRAKNWTASSSGQEAECSRAAEEPTANCTIL